MASILYREGKGTVEHGIECESTVCEADQVPGLLNSGWSTNPPGYVAPEPASVAEDETDDVDVEGIEDVKEWLYDQIANLKEQNRILAEMDETSKSELARLNRVIEDQKAIEIERDALRDDVDRLVAEVAELRAAQQVETDDESAAEDEPEPEEVDPSAHLNPVRLQAKEAGIEGWDTKRIATLEKALAEQ